jgi:hypothetical protein
LFYNTRIGLYINTVRWQLSLRSILEWHIMRCQYNLKLYLGSVLERKRVRSKPNTNTNATINNLSVWPILERISLCRFLVGCVGAIGS